MEDGTKSLISNAYILTQARKKTTSNTGRWRIAICNCNVKKEIKPPQWGGKLLKNECCQCLFSLNLTQKIRVKSKHNSIAAYIFPKNLIPWRDSNPGLLFLRRMSDNLVGGKDKIAAKLPWYRCVGDAKWNVIMISFSVNYFH
jgi:hypothetical protein